MIKTSRLLELKHIDDNGGEKKSGVNKRNKLVNAYWCERTDELCLNNLYTLIQKDKFLLSFDKNAKYVENIVTIDYNAKYNITTFDITNPYEFFTIEIDYTIPHLFKQNMAILKNGKNVATNYLKKKYNLTTNHKYDMLFIWKTVKNNNEDPYKMSHNHLLKTITVIKQLFKQLAMGGNFIVALNEIHTNLTDKLIYYLNTLFEKSFLYRSKYGLYKNVFFYCGINLKKYKNFDDLNTNINFTVSEFLDNSIKKKLKFRQFNDLLYKLTNVFPFNNKLKMLNEYSYLYDSIKWCKQFNVEIKSIYLNIFEKNIGKFLGKIKMVKYIVQHKIPNINSLYNMPKLVDNIKDHLNFLEYINVKRNIKVPDFVANKLNIKTPNDANIWEIIMDLGNTNHVHSSMSNLNINKINSILSPSGEPLTIVNNVHDLKNDTNYIIQTNITHVLNNLNLYTNIVKKYRHIQFISPSWLYDYDNIYLSISYPYIAHKWELGNDNSINTIMEHQITNALFNIVNHHTNTFYGHYIVKKTNVHMIDTKKWTKWLAVNI